MRIPNLASEMNDVPTPAPSHALAELARNFGVATEYWDWQGNHVIVSAPTISAVLGALGLDVSDDAAITRSLAVVADRAWRRTLPPIVVSREKWPAWVPLHLPDGAAADMWVVLEDDSRREIRQVDHYVEPRVIDGRPTGEATFEVPGDLPLGWHTLHARIGEETFSTPLVVSPIAVALPPALQRRSVWGLMSQIYSVRSRQSWGLGDLADLADLGAWAADDLGADFVLVNPLHAAEAVAPMEPSPYLPTSRRFVNPIYIRVEDIPEMGYVSAAEKQMLEWHGDDARMLNEADTIDRDAVWAAKVAALRLVYHQARSSRRERAFTAFCEREGQALLDFATWCALSEKHGPSWGQWPAELPDPRSPSVEPRTRGRAVLEVEVVDECERHREHQRTEIPEASSVPLKVHVAAEQPEHQEHRGEEALGERVIVMCVAQPLPLEVEPPHAELRGERRLALAELRFAVLSAIEVVHERVVRPRAEGARHLQSLSARRRFAFDQ